MSSQAKGSATGSAVSSTTSSSEKVLRKPGKQTEERLFNGRYEIHDENENQSTQPTSKKLSADAPEFVPQVTLQTGNDRSEHSSLTVSALSASAPEFVPRSSTSYTATSQEQLYGQFQRLVLNCPTHLSGNVISNHCSVTDLFKNAVFMLTTNPGGLEEHIKPVVDRLKTVTDTEVRDEIINILLEQGIMEPNFRYTGARLCKYLTAELRNHRQFADFRNHFLNRCGEEYEKRETLVTNPKTVDRLCGLTMFFGELFSHLEIEKKDGTFEKIGVLRRSLHQLIMTLLSHPDDTTVKCATQLLKMTGATIDDTSHLQGDFDEVYRRINELKGMTTLNSTSKCLINSVLSLKDGNWGRGSSSSSPQKPTGFSMMQQTQSLQNFVVDDPVFYDPMGQPITREEAGFYQEPEDYEGFNPDDPENHYHWNEDQYEEWVYQPWNDGPNAYLHWSSNPDDIPYDDVNEDQYVQEYPNDMDDEMMAAYEEFLEGQPQNH